jgi:nucleoid-associated protein YgaU
VTVRPGDSLWAIAAERLGGTPSAARIQAEWPRWYAANRRMIGTDPNLVRPGASLLVPEPARTENGR